MARSTRTAEAPRPARALVRDMTPAASAPTLEVVLEARPAIDFLVSLILDTESELLPADRDWLAESRASLSDALQRDYARVFGDERRGQGDRRRDRAARRGDPGGPDGGRRGRPGGPHRRPRPRRRALPTATR